ncbi:DUF1064 domain-containing protein [candidate division KSB1 bacterium]|nr:DUF1064 domain-containing protein [candidate division KSB1 bacterium]
MAKPSKYHSIKTIIDGHKFDSKKEARRYSDLLLLQKSGEIKDLKLQPKYELQPRFIWKKKVIRPIYYVADFEYFDLIDNELVVEDTKGFQTKEYKLKRKLFIYKYPKINFIET